LALSSANGCESGAAAAGTANGTAAATKAAASVLVGILMFISKFIQISWRQTANSLDSTVANAPRSTFCSFRKVDFEPGHAW
jgi:hypothetical protein